MRSYATRSTVPAFRSPNSNSGAWGFGDGAEDVRGFRKACADRRVVPTPSLLLRSAMAEARTVSDPAGNAKLSKGSQGGQRVRARDDAAAAGILAVAAGIRAPAAPRSRCRDDPHWKSVDQASQTFIEALAKGEDADPWGDTVLPVPDRFTEKGEPPVVTLTGLRPPGGIEVTGGTVRIRFVEHAGTVTTEAADPPAPPGNKPLVTIGRRTDGAPDVTVSGRPCTRGHSGSRRHRTAAGRLIAAGIPPSQTACLAPLRAGAGFRPGAAGRNAGASR